MFDSFDKAVESQLQRAYRAIACMAKFDPVWWDEFNTLLERGLGLIEACT